MILETKRVYLREFLHSDIKALSEIYSNAEIMKYMGRGGPLNAEQTLKMINYWQSEYKNYGYGFWAMINKEDEKLIGHCGFSFIKEAGETEIAYLLDKPYWGKGFATEISKKTLEYGFDKFNFKKVIALVYPDNKQSIRVIEKMGMSFEREGIFFERKLYMYSVVNKNII